MPASGFVDVFGSDENTIGMMRLALRPIRRIATDHTDRQRFGYVLGDGEKLRHRLEWFAPVVLVEACNDNSFPLISEEVTDFHEISFEKLAFVDPHHLSILAEFKDFQGIIDNFHPKVFAFRLEDGVDQSIADGTWLRLGDKDFRVLHTPGHSEDSICLFCPETGALFSGDTLYRISDAEGSYPGCYVRSLERLRDLNAKVIYPGHGEPILDGIRAFIDETIENVSASILH